MIRFLVSSLKSQVKGVKSSTKDKVLRTKTGNFESVMKSLENRFLLDQLPTANYRFPLTTLLFQNLCGQKKTSKVCLLQTDY